MNMNMILMEAELEDGYMEWRQVRIGEMTHAYLLFFIIDVSDSIAEKRERIGSLFCARKSKKEEEKYDDDMVGFDEREREYEGLTRVSVSHCVVF